MAETGGILDKFLDRHAFFQALIFDPLVRRVARFGLGLLRGRVKNDIEQRNQKAANRFTFAEALNRLFNNERGVHDCIVDFMHHPDGLTNDTDREDFEHNSAKVGNDLDGTVQALRRLALAFPDHKARRAHIDALGWIGQRGVDTLEHAQAMAKATGHGISVGAKAVGRTTVVVVKVVAKKVDGGLDKVEAHLVDSSTGTPVNKGTKFRDKWKEELNKLTT